MIHRGIPIVLLAILPICTASAQSTYKLASIDASQATIDFDFSALAPPGAAPWRLAEQLDLEYVTGSDGQAALAKMVFLPPNIRVAGVQVLQTEAGPTLPAELLPDAKIFHPGETATSKVIPATAASHEFTSLRALGVIRGFETTALYIFPIQAAGPNEVQLWRRIRVRLNFAENIAAPAAFSLLSRKAFLEKIALLPAPPAAAQPKKAGAGQAGANAASAGNTAPVRIVVDTDGLYKITWEDLRDAQIEVPKNLDPWKLRLMNKGKAVPIYIHDRQDRSFDPGDYLEFYGEYSRAPMVEGSPDVYLDIYSQKNIYWLDWEGAGAQRLIEEEGLVLETDPRNFRSVYSFPAKLHIERDQFYNRLSQYQEQKPRDHWFMDNGIFSSEKREYNLPLKSPDNQSDMPVALRLMFHGQTFDQGVPHQVEVFFNNRLVLGGKWEGQTPFDLQSTASAPISSTVLSNFRNSLTIVNRSSVEVIDNFLLNWIEITYPRLLVADEGTLEFTIPARQRLGLFDFTVRGFETDQISLYKLGTSKIVGADINRIETLDGEVSYELHFQDEAFTNEVRYFAVEERAKLKPVLIEPHLPMDLRDPAIAADYIMIVADSLFEGEALKTLIAHRQQQGHTVLAVNIREVFNQFSDGLFSPYAIRAFLRYAYNNWPAPPRFVLLVGDGSFDNRNLNQMGTNRIPVISQQMAKYGASASDHWYTLMTPGDQFPDLALGRLPVNTEEELATMVAKIVEYESQAAREAWQNRFLLIGGNGQIFREQSEELTRKVLPPRLDIQRVYSLRDPQNPDDPFFGGTADVVEKLNEGLFLVNFMGHGGGAIWADNSLLRLEDVDKLRNKGKYPIVTSMTCFTGAFDEPNRQTLSERLLLTPDAGAVAVWASSGLGWSLDDFLIARELFDMMAEFGNRLTLGELFVLAKTDYILKYRNLPGFSIVNQYNLLGDPGLRLQLPDEHLEVSIGNPLPTAGDTITVAGKAEFSAGEATLEVTDEDLRILSTTSTGLQESRFKQQLQLPAGFAAERAFIRVYAKGADGTRHSSIAKEIDFTRIAVDTAYAATVEDSLRVFARVKHRRPLQKIEAEFSLPAADTIALVLDESSGLYTTARALPKLAPNAWLRFKVHVADVDGNDFRSLEFEQKQPGNPELVLYDNRLRLVGDTSVGLQVEAFNLGETVAPGVAVRFERQGENGGPWQLVGADTLTLAPKSSASARVNFIPGSGQLIIRVTIDPDNRFAENIETNNTIVKPLQVDVFPLIADLGTTLGAATSDTISYDNRIRFFVGPSAVAANSAIKITRMASFGLENQPDFHGVLQGAGIVAYEFAPADSSVIPAVPGADIRFRIDDLTVVQQDSAVTPLGTVANAAICRYDRPHRKWRKVSTTRTARELYGSLSLPGIYGLLVVDDNLPPRVDVTVEGQLFSEGGFVPEKPVIGVTAQDLNGVDPGEASLRIWVDETPLSRQELTFADSAITINGLAVQFRTAFTPGTHSLRLQVADNAGNLSQLIERQFKVAGEQELHFLGNYPNPFRTRTTFAFELTDHAEDVELKIYTTSGHLIRSIGPAEIVEDPNPLGPNYHEITWDARDAAGERVANGMYYYKLRVKFRERVAEQVGRVARLQ